MASLPDLVVEHQQVQAGVTSLADEALRSLWGTLDLTDANAVRDALLDTFPDLVQTYGDVAATTGADFYTALREQAGASGAFSPEPAAPFDRERADVLVRASVAPLYGGTGADAALTLVSGSLARAVLAADRDTVRQNVARDPQAHGWQRFTRPGSCDFCRMLAGRGEVYRKDTARFGSHGHCHCTAAPAFAPGMSLKTVQYVATKRNVSDADRARVRAFLAQPA